MFLLLVLVIGFFITGGTFGANLIGAFELVIYAWWFLSILITTIIIILGFTPVAIRERGISTKIVNLISSIGILLFIVLGFYTYTMLWLSYFIIENTSPTAINWENIGETAQNTIVVYLVITVLFITQSKFSFRFFTITTKGKKDAI